MNPQSLVKFFAILLSFLCEIKYDIFRKKKRKITIYRKVKCQT